MQSKNPLLDDLSNLVTNAFGVAQNAKGEMETALKSMLDRWLVDRNLVTHEELEALKMMINKLSTENKILVERIEKLESYSSLTKQTKSKKN